MTWVLSKLMTDDQQPVCCSRPDQTFIREEWGTLRRRRENKNGKRRLLDVMFGSFQWECRFCKYCIHIYIHMYLKIYIYIYIHTYICRVYIKQVYYISIYFAVSKIYLQVSLQRVSIGDLSSGWQACWIQRIYDRNQEITHIEGIKQCKY